jgi:hypothetical protein
VKSQLGNETLIESVKLARSPLHAIASKLEASLRNSSQGDEKFNKASPMKIQASSPLPHRTSTLLHLNPLTPSSLQPVSLVRPPLHSPPASTLDLKATVQATSSPAAPSIRRSSVRDGGSVAPKEDASFFSKIEPAQSFLLDQTATVPSSRGSVSSWGDEDFNESGTGASQHHQPKPFPSTVGTHAPPQVQPTPSSSLHKPVYEVLMQPSVQRVVVASTLSNLSLRPGAAVAAVHDRSGLFGALVLGSLSQSLVSRPSSSSSKVVATYLQGKKDQVVQRATRMLAGKKLKALVEWYRGRVFSVEVRIGSSSGSGSEVFSTESPGAAVPAKTQAPAPLLAKTEVRDDDARLSVPLEHHRSTRFTAPLAKDQVDAWFHADIHLSLLFHSGDKGEKVLIGEAVVPFHHLLLSPSFVLQGKVSFTYRALADARNDHERTASRKLAFLAKLDPESKALVEEFARRTRIPSSSSTSAHGMSSPILSWEDETVGSIDLKLQLDALSNDNARHVPTFLASNQIILPKGLFEPAELPSNSFHTSALYPIDKSFVSRVSSSWNAISNVEGISRPMLASPIISLIEKLQPNEINLAASRGLAKLLRQPRDSSNPQPVSNPALSLSMQAIQGILPTPRELEKITNKSAVDFFMGTNATFVSFTVELLLPWFLTSKGAKLVPGGSSAGAEASVSGLSIVGPSSVTLSTIRTLHKSDESKKKQFMFAPATSSVALNFRLFDSSDQFCTSFIEKLSKASIAVNVYATCVLQSLEHPSKSNMKTKKEFKSVLVGTGSIPLSSAVIGFAFHDIDPSSTPSPEQVVYQREPFYLHNPFTQTSMSSFAALSLRLHPSISDAALHVSRDSQAHIIQRFLRRRKLARDHKKVSVQAFVAPAPPPGPSPSAKPAEVAHVEIDLNETASNQALLGIIESVKEIEQNLKGIKVTTKPVLLTSSEGPKPELGKRELRSKSPSSKPWRGPLASEPTRQQTMRSLRTHIRRLASQQANPAPAPSTSTSLSRSAVAKLPLPAFQSITRTPLSLLNSKEAFPLPSFEAVPQPPPQQQQREVPPASLIDVAAIGVASEGKPDPDLDNLVKAFYRLSPPPLEAKSSTTGAQHDGSSPTASTLSTSSEEDAPPREAAFPFADRPPAHPLASPPSPRGQRAPAAVSLDSSFWKRHQDSANSISSRWIETLEEA